MGLDNAKSPKKPFNDAASTEKAFLRTFEAFMKFDANKAFYPNDDHGEKLNNQLYNKVVEAFNRLPPEKRWMATGAKTPAAAKDAGPEDKLLQAALERQQQNEETRKRLHYEMNNPSTSPPAAPARDTQMDSFPEAVQQAFAQMKNKYGGPN